MAVLVESRWFLLLNFYYFRIFGRNTVENSIAESIVEPNPYDVFRESLVAWYENRTSLRRVPGRPGQFMNL